MKNRFSEEQIIKIVTSSIEKEQARIIINKAFQKYQLILQDNFDLIPIEKCDEELSGKFKDLLVLSDQNIVVGTALLNIEQKDIAYVLYLSKSQNFPKKIGINLMKHAENRAKDVYKKKKMRVSTVYHPEHKQERLENWYLKQGYEFLLQYQPNEKQQQAWKLKYQKDARFRYFEKTL